MKLVLVSVAALAFASSEPAGDVEIQQVEVIEVPWQEEPQQEYGPPKQEYEPPKQEYGPPKPVYGPPKPVYGPPPETTTTEAASTTTEYPTTTVVSSNSTTNSTRNNSTRARLENDPSAEKGVYYIYHPNGVLQRVLYAAKDDVRNMEYSAQLKYQDVEPIRGPIYSYDPATYVFNRIIAAFAFTGVVAQWRPVYPVPEAYQAPGTTDQEFLPPLRQTYRPRGPPLQNYGPPRQNSEAPQQNYGPPPQNYGPPQENLGPPPQNYGPPQQNYGPPLQYGPPGEPTTVLPETTTTEAPTTTETNDLEGDELVSGVDGEDGEKLTNAEKGVYYIYHPTGLLQRVVYATKDDAERMAFSAQLKYENVEPITGPIYTYDPETYVFRKLHDETLSVKQDIIRQIKINVAVPAYTSFPFGPDKGTMPTARTEGRISCVPWIRRCFRVKLYRGKGEGKGNEKQRGQLERRNSIQEGYMSGIERYKLLGHESEEITNQTKAIKFWAGAERRTKQQKVNQFKISSLGKISRVACNWKQLENCYRSLKCPLQRVRILTFITPFVTAINRCINDKTSY
ncbi:hypothetical protein NQ315_008668 [Exocentrus adspersus]|uniref:Uncharacterized protein n=1 Tax=Exocentrus adspersus TaxID=1586481 RepID=A0AAV8W5U2_9CUCU|nr:hypothetical protein NQ315_008668 [Exocentrus adspersus]